MRLLERDHLCVFRHAVHEDGAKEASACQRRGAHGARWAISIS